jgi:hypothetical protein
MSFSFWPVEGNKKTYITPNWCDPTTWYQKSISVTDEVATSEDSGAGVLWALSHINIIDNYHGKITGEDGLEINGVSPRVSVKIDGVTKTEQDPHFASGGDFVLNYSTGVLTLLTSSPGSEVKVSYHYSNGSEFVISPNPGTKLRFNLVEAQFSGDIELKDSCIFEMYGLVDVFAPQLVSSGAVASGTKIRLGKTVYKTLLDFMNDANGYIPTAPALDQNSWRGLSSPIYVFIWQYVSMTTLSAAAGMEVRIRLEHETSFGGSMSTASFYCVEEQEGTI